jgi:hydrogenase maturation protease
MNSPRIDLLILGLGNPLCSDDGLGVVAVHELQARFAAPEGVAVMDGGTLGLSLLPHLQDARAAILVDAIRTDDPPGSLVRIEGEAVAPAVACRLSPHQVGVADLLDAARLLGQEPEPLLLLGIVPAHLGLGFGLSAPVRDRMEELLLSVLEEASRLGYPLLAKARDEVEPARLHDPLPLGTRL